MNDYSDILDAVSHDIAIREIQWFSEPERAKSIQAGKDDFLRGNFSSYEDCYKRFCSAVLPYGSHMIEAWEFYTDNFEVIPADYRMRIILKGIYDSRANDFMELLFHIALAYVVESSDEKLRRGKEILDAIGPYFQSASSEEEPCITLYRGENDKSVDEYHAISYTTSKEQAQWFADRWNLLGCRGQVIERVCPISDVLHYTDDREEKEVMIISPHIRDKIHELMTLQGKEFAIT